MLKRKAVLIRPVRPNVGLRAWYETKLTALIEAMAASMERHIVAAWREAKPNHGLAQDATSTVTLQRSMNKWGKLWTNRFNLLSRGLAAQFADKSHKVTETAVKAAFKASGFTVEFKPTISSTAAYHAVAAENVNLIKSIPQQYLKDVQQQVWESVMVGGDLSALSINLKKAYSITVKRAALIARDQNAKAKAVIENVRRREIGITEARWQHSTAGKVPRPSHVAMNGKLYNLNEGMWDDDEGKYVLPGQLINCRCSSSAIIAGFDD